MNRVGLLIVLVLLGTMLLGGLVLSQASARSSTSGGYVVEVGTATGAGYHLAGRSWQVDGATGGAGYQLEAPLRPLQGAGCCCAFLPCVFDNATP